MLTRGRIDAILLGAALTAVGVMADAPKDSSKPAQASGLLTEVHDKEGFVMIWPDGEESPIKYVLADSFDKKTFGFPPACKGVFSPDRVKFTYSTAGDARTVLVMDKEPQQAKGAVTGIAMFASDFWVAVKPKNGPLDGYAMGRPPGWQEIGERLKTVQKGDTVTISFYTDVERHRIVTLAVVPRKPGDEIPSLKPKAATTQPRAVAPTSSSAASVPPATSQPAQTAEQQARGKLGLAQLYIDNGLKDQARDMLREIIKLYPNTDAAKEARTKLTALGG